MPEKIFESQNNYGWGLTFDMTGKVPIINKRIFDKLTDAQAFADDYNDSAIPGLLLSIINDTEENNGAYFLKRIKKNENDNTSQLIKIGSESTKIDEMLNTLIGNVDGDDTKSVREIAREEIITEYFNKKIFKTLDNANDFINDTNNININGLVISITNDSEENNGTYYIKKDNESYVLEKLISKNEVHAIKNNIDNYTINNKKISENPIISTHDLEIDKAYTTTNNPYENVVPGDILTSAISKLEVTLANTTLALTAAITDLNRKIEEIRNIIIENEIISASALNDLNNKTREQNN